MACEKQIKHACSSHFGKSAALLSEFTYADGKRRADLVAIKESLHAIEIKSDVDTLQRLDSQLTDYLKIFDLVSCVTTEKYIHEIRARVPKCVGLFQYKDDQIYEMRRPKKNSRTKNYSRLTLLKSSELDAVSKAAGFSTYKMDVHSKRTLLAQKLSKGEIDTLVIETYSRKLLA